MKDKVERADEAHRAEGGEERGGTDNVSSRFYPAVSAEEQVSPLSEDDVADVLEAALRSQARVSNVVADEEDTCPNGWKPVRVPPPPSQLECEIDREKFPENLCTSKVNLGALSAQKAALFHEICAEKLPSQTGDTSVERERGERGGAERGRGEGSECEFGFDYEQCPLHFLRAVPSIAESRATTLRCYADPTAGRSPLCAGVQDLSQFPSDDARQTWAQNCQAKFPCRAKPPFETLKFPLVSKNVLAPPIPVPAHNRPLSLPNGALPSSRQVQTLRGTSQAALQPDTEVEEIA